jgi:large subunit ribosomal protein L9
VEVILLEKIQNLGDLGDLVKVRPGYARNFLVPQGKAAPATPENRAKFEQQRKELEKTAEEKLTHAQQRAQAIDGVIIEIARRVSEEDKLFGSVTTGDIAEAMQQLGHDLQRSEIHLSEGPLKTIGEHEVAVTLHPEVHCTVKVVIVAEE